MSGAVGAFFDVDGTLTRSDIFRDLVTFRRQEPRDLAWQATWPLRGLLLLALDPLSRTAVNRLTYRSYRGAKQDRLASWARSFQRGPGMARFRVRGIELLRRHLDLGHRVVLVTGALEEIVAPLPDILAERLDEPRFRDIRVEAARLVREAGTFTGRIDGEPLGGVEKARRVRELAASEGLDLDLSHAYGDSIADLPMLEAVGRPAAIEPDARLRRVARRRGWPILDLDDDRRARA